MGDAVRQKWSLTQEAFDGLLQALDRDRDVAAGRYLDMRSNLVRLFEWRGCSTPEEYADETINRCAKKIAEGDEIRDVPTFCVGIARMLLHEMHRELGRRARPLDEVPEPRIMPTVSEENSDHGVECLRHCLSELAPRSRDLILSYYQGDKGEKIKNRRGLQELFGIPASTLRMRALRLRERLQWCTEKCLQRQGVAAM